MKTIAKQLKIKEFPFEIKDKEGNLLYQENSNGRWERCEYDSARNKIYFETSNGYWSVKEYDSENREISHKDSLGFWAKYEYDSEGHRIYFENSSGLIIDNRPKPDDVITLNGIKYKRIDE